MSLEGSHRGLLARVGRIMEQLEPGLQRLDQPYPPASMARRIFDAACWMRSSDEVSASMPVRYDGSTVTVYEITSSRAAMDS
jgi:hypothetical protein